MKNSRIVVIGTSAGGMEALTKLVSQLPRKFAAPVFVVQHMSPESTAAVLVGALEESGVLPCKVARNGERFKTGHIYIAPPDNHLLLETKTLILTKGARENRYRPAIDPLF